MGKKTTDKELVQELSKLNSDGRYNWIINRAENFEYHCFKFDVVNPNTHIVSPKLELVTDLAGFPELNGIREDVIAGVYDESPDSEDVERIRQILKEEGSEDLFDILGL